MFEELIGSKFLTFDRLHAVVLLNEAGSLIEAAKRDPDVASRLSHRLAELSEFFGTALTTREGRTLKLTPAGETLARLAREQLIGIQAFRDDAKGVVRNYSIGAGDNLMQWLLVPAIGRIRRDKNFVRVTLCNLRTKQIVDRLKERRIEFGIIRKDALDEPLKHVQICEQKYAVFVPRRLVTSSGLLSLKEALLRNPHATIAGEGQFIERLRGLAGKMGGKFVPEMICDSIGECVAAVQTGAFAAVLPVQAWSGGPERECVVVEDEALKALNRLLVLAWHPGTLDVMGDPARKMLRLLTEALKRVGEDAVAG
jgi:DNA-binding transcriptional LysR family regulator